MFRKEWPPHIFHCAGQPRSWAWQDNRVLHRLQMLPPATQCFCCSTLTNGSQPFQWQTVAVQLSFEEDALKGLAFYRLPRSLPLPNCSGSPRPLSFLSVVTALSSFSIKSYSYKYSWGTSANNCLHWSYLLWRWSRAAAGSSKNTFFPSLQIPDRPGRQKRAAGKKYYDTSHLFH